MQRRVSAQRALHEGRDLTTPALAEYVLPVGIVDIERNGLVLRPTKLERQGLSASSRSHQAAAARASVSKSPKKDFSWASGHHGLSVAGATMRISQPSSLATSQRAKARPSPFSSAE